MIVITEKEVDKKKKSPSYGNSEEVKAAQEAQGMNIERKVSHGIGGYGNIRRPSDVPFPPKSSPSRHNSIWSKFSISPGSPGTSPTERRGSFLNAFRKNSVSESEAPLMDDDNIGPKNENATQQS